MEKIIKIFLTIFSIYRLSSLLASEEGPYLPFLYKDKEEKGVFEWLRDRLGAYDYVYEYDDRGNQRVKIITNLGRGISCPLCVGGYVSFLFILIYFLPSKFTRFLLLWFGMWGVQVFMENLTSDDAVEDAIQDVAESLEDTDGRSENAS